MNLELDAPATTRVSSYGHVLSLVDGRGRDTKPKNNKERLELLKMEIVKLVKIQ